MTSRLLLACALALAALPAPADPASNFDVQQLADGVYAVVRKEPPGLMVDANNLFIIGPDDVVVVDANGAPAITRAVLAALRAITPKPVRYVINTHYHDDHIRGNRVYRDAFPRVDVVAHAFARDYLPNQGAVSRKDFLDNAPGFVTQLRGLVADGRSLTGGPLTAEERESLTSDIALADLVLRDGASAEAILPTVAVTDRLTIAQGRRTIEVRHLGRGHTAADLVVYLPQDGILAAGDLAGWPVPLVGDPQSFVGDWSATLRAMADLKPAIVVPGHGPVLRGTAHVAALAEMFASIRRQAGEAVARGETLEQARAGMNLAAFRDRLAGESPVRRLLFATYVARPAVGAAYREASAGK